MSILIENMEMPKDGETVTLTICADGLTFEEFKEPGDVFHAVPIPPHGRLIDADALYGTIEASKDGTIGHTTFKDTVLLNIRGMPTIIEAEEGEQ